MEVTKLNHTVVQWRNIVVPLSVIAALINISKIPRFIPQLFTETITLGCHMLKM